MRQLWVATEQNDQIAVGNILRSIDSKIVAQVINQQNSDGWTPLHVAANEGHAELIQVFINFGS